MYKALYRKYRPDRFSRIVGQQHIVQTLENALEQGKTAHAYLFHGPRGTGKTSIAKIFAEALNCENITALETPCHDCDACRLIDSGESSDIIELDAASNNGVDEIRQIREFAKYAPTNLTKKVYIIDEVHMLSTAAFNALLKTLEEPPAHVVFILATTEIHKIPLTIISRCQRFDFKKVTQDEMVECLTPILAAEQVTIDEDALAYLTAFADGGMRDALSVLDQAIAYAGGTTISLQNVLDVIGSVGVETYMQIVQDIINKKSNRILAVVQEVIDSGKNVQLFVEEFIQYLLKEIENNLKGEPMFPTDDLFSLLDEANQLATKMRTAYLPHIALQAFFLELTYTRPEKKASEVLVESVQQASQVVEESIAPTKLPVTSTEVPVQVQPEVVTEMPPVQAQSEVTTVDKVVVTQEIANIETKNEINKPVVVAEQETVTIANNTELVDMKTAASGAATTSLEASSVDEVMDLFTYDPVFDNQDELEEVESSEEIDLVFNFNEKNVMPKENAPEVAQQVEVAIDTNTPMAPLAEAVVTANSSEATQENVSKDVTGRNEPSTQAITMDIFDTALHDKRVTNQLQRVMAEVVIYPEYNQLEKIKRRWQTIRFDPTNPIVGMLLDMDPKIATKTEIVLSCYNKSLANQLQLEPQISKAEAYVSTLLGETRKLIITDEAKWTKEREVFAVKWKANEVSATTIETLAQDYITLEEEAAKLGYEYAPLFEEEQVIETESDVVRDAKALFGETIVEVVED